MPHVKHTIIHSIPPFRWYYFFGAIPFYLVSLLPFPVMYALSDVIVWLLRDVIGYRKSVIETNLQRAFPEHNSEERHHIVRAFYYNLVDVFLETIKTLSLSHDNLKRHFVFTNLHIIERHLQSGSVMVVLGHMGNWEWGGFSYTLHTQQQTNTLYHPLSNAFFNWLMHHLRSKCGLFVIPMHQSLKSMLHYNATPCTHALIADQSPPPETAYWTRFMHQDTGFFTGTEKLAAKMKLPVFYAHIKRQSRGRYECTFIEITTNAANEKSGVITESFSRLLEANIRAYPEQWLWSHRRWKHAKLK